MGAWLYILQCNNKSYYTGVTLQELEMRVAEHNQGTYKGYTFDKRPVTLVYSQFYDDITEANNAERQIKGWSRVKKEAIIEGKFELLPELASRPTARK